MFTFVGVGNGNNRSVVDIYYYSMYNAIPLLKEFAMIHKDGNLGISFESQELVVHEFVPDVPWWPEHGSWREVARCTEVKQWDECSYSKLLTDQYLQDMITWHFIDQVTPTLTGQEFFYTYSIFDVNH